MSFKATLDAFTLLDSAKVTGDDVVAALKALGAENVTSTTIQGPRGSTDFVKIVIPGSKGRSSGGDAPTLGVIGRLGGIGARPEMIGFVSDGDGAAAAVAVAMKLARMAADGDVLPGDVICATHICPDAPTQPHDPVPFMGSPVDMAAMNKHEVDPAMDAILSIDTTKGNRIINHRGFAISPTVKDGWILRVSEDLLGIMSITTGQLPVTFPITMQDITPYGNGVSHQQHPPARHSHLRPGRGRGHNHPNPVPGCGTAQATWWTWRSVRFVIETARHSARASAGSTMRMMRHPGEALRRDETPQDPRVAGSVRR